MTAAVHLFDARQAASIRRSGIKGHATQISVPQGRISIDRAVFLMPVLPDFYASHQWLRELKRRGMRTIAAAYVKLRADRQVFVGRYNGEHRLVPLGHAAGLIMHATDPRGMQIVVPGDIAAAAIHAIRDVPQIVGWRYFPESHEKGPWKCLCEYCTSRASGEIKVQRLWRRLVAQSGEDPATLDEATRRRMRG